MQLTSETRSDLAHFAEWTETVTQSIEEMQEVLMQMLSILQGRQDAPLADLEQQRLQNQRDQAEFRQRMEELRQRQVESDQRFKILLKEIRFLIRQQKSP
ncbi:hypothetical protein L1047_11315 [Synechococcus sp. Nb3U1]|uniref:hypothetical protein n=1 Tax=Synechococcus sp. Nb3U1 TaxID=1914529 RepID=UPI001F25CF0D|nr:hypothetical protein [Synechococcus sp. Nb3U1]MCF2971784.1 hypothetical protein [Synechococcus sp. Nb3U1]